MIITRITSGKQQYIRKQGFTYSNTKRYRLRFMVDNGTNQSKQSSFPEAKITKTGIEPKDAFYQQNNSSHNTITEMAIDKSKP